VNEILVRIEMLTAVVLNEALPDADRIAAADEVLMWGGPVMTRAALAKNIGFTAGCLHGAAFECRCDEWQSLAELVRSKAEVWPDAMAWEPTPNPGDGSFWLQRRSKCALCGDALAAGDIARFDDQGEIVCEGCGP
jgi:hypothetical protein